MNGGSRPVRPQSPSARARAATLLALIALAVASCGSETNLPLGPGEEVAPGLHLYRFRDPTILDQPAPISIDLLRLDPSKVAIRSALALDEVMGTETVVETAARHRALAAVNAGFFAPNGDPAGLLKVGGELVSDTALARGAVALVSGGPGSRQRLVFDQVAVKVIARVHDRHGTHDVPIDGVDTTRVRGRLMLFTPRYHEHTDTAGNGVEWVARGRPLRIVDHRVDQGSTAIPRDGVVLSFGGMSPPDPLDHLSDSGTTIDVRAEYTTRRRSSPELWSAASDAIGGAGLLVSGGQLVTDWEVERLRPGFTTERHPRTILGVTRSGAVWLAVVDGRNPEVSIGMTFAELQRLARGLRLVDALNLDGGGSTTMVVRGRVVNRPSDASGPRKVSDALLVFAQG